MTLDTRELGPHRDVLPVTEGGELVQVLLPIWSGLHTTIKTQTCCRVAPLRPPALVISTTEQVDASVQERRADSSCEVLRANDQSEGSKRTDGQERDEYIFLPFLRVVFVRAGRWSIWIWHPKCIPLRSLIVLPRLHYGATLCGMPVFNRRSRQGDSAGVKAEAMSRCEAQTEHVYV